MNEARPIILLRFHSQLISNILNDSPEFSPNVPQSKKKKRKRKKISDENWNIKRKKKFKNKNEACLFILMPVTRCLGRGDHRNHMYDTLVVPFIRADFWTTQATSKAKMKMFQTWSKYYFPSSPSPESQLCRSSNVSRVWGEKVLHHSWVKCFILTNIQ